MIQRTKRSARTAERRIPVWLLLILAAAAVAAAVLHRDNTLTQTAREHAQATAVAGAGVYVTLRSLNAFLSAAQEIELGGSFVVSGTVQPLKTLEPVDDTIERIAGIVFAMMIATGVLAVSMGPLGAVGAAMIALALALWVADRIVGRRDIVVVLARRLVWYGAFLAIAVPVSFLAASVIADELTREVWEANQAVIRDITEPLAADQTDAQGLGDRLWAAREDAEEYRRLAVNIYDRADDLIGSYVAILAVFLFKLLILPLLLLGALFLVARFFADPPPGRAD